MQYLDEKDHQYRLDLGRALLLFRYNLLSFRKSSRFETALALSSGSGVSARIRART